MMNIEDIRTYCLSLPGTTEEIKWGNDLCFSIGGKMYCVTGLTGPLTVSFKVNKEDFHEVSRSDGFTPAPYVARYQWILLEKPQKVSRKDLQAYIKQSYELIKSKLSKKALKQYGLN